jgi:uncharacterized protein
MKKRSNIEIQIRNALSEVLILSLKAREKSALLHSVFCFCRLVKGKEQSEVKLADLLEHQEDMGRVRLSWKEISEGFSSLAIVEMDSENFIQIGRQFTNYLPDICIRVERYWKFISGLYSRGVTFKDGIEGEIKKGILVFNEGLYFECHEFLEEAWRKEKGEEKSFLQGLIYSAVAFYHVEYKNYGGAARYLKMGCLRLEEFKPTFLSVDVETFLADMWDYAGLLEKSSFDDLEILKSAIPIIKLME